MELLDKVQEIFNQHELKPLMLPEGHKDVYTFLKAYPEFKKDFETSKDDGYLINKYKTHIPRGWYGFSIGEPIVPEWNDIIEKILDICIEADPSFEIYQIKLKYGRICFYCESQIIEDLDKIESLIDDSLFDKGLIY